MMMLAAQEYDRAAEIRAAENADMRALFRASAQAVAEPELRSTLERAAGAAEGSLKVSALNAVNAALRGHLIRLHAYAEENALRDLDRQIWTVLKASAERRILKLP
jgi:hypothetical protein